MNITSRETFIQAKVTTEFVEFTTDSGTPIMFSHCPQNGSYTVIYDTEAKGPRRTGKTFYSADEMIAHYRSIREELLRCCQIVRH